MKTFTYLMNSDKKDWFEITFMAENRNEADNKLKRIINKLKVAN